MLTNKVGERLWGLPFPSLPPDVRRVCPEVYQTAVHNPLVHFVCSFIQYPLSSRRQDRRAVHSPAPGGFRNNIHRVKGAFQVEDLDGCLPSGKGRPPGRRCALSLSLHFLSVSPVSAW